MRLSEAIRLGAMLRPQEFSMVFRKHGDQYCSCAIGAAAEAAGQEPNDDNEGLILAIKTWPILSTYARCPYTHTQEKIWSIIAYMNNRNRSTREAIACWVKELEDQMETPHEEPAVAAATTVTAA